MVGCTIVCCLSEVDDELGHGRTRNERAVEGEEDALDWVKSG